MPRTSSPRRMTTSSPRIRRPPSWRRRTPPWRRRARRRGVGAADGSDAPSDRRRVSSAARPRGRARSGAAAVAVGGAPSMAACMVVFLPVAPGVRRMGGTSRRASRGTAEGAGHDGDEERHDPEQHEGGQHAGAERQHEPDAEGGGPRRARRARDASEPGGLGAQQLGDRRAGASRQGDAPRRPHRRADDASPASSRSPRARAGARDRPRRRPTSRWRAARARVRRRPLRGSRARRARRSNGDRPRAARRRRPRRRSRGGCRTSTPIVSNPRVVPNSIGDATAAPARAGRSPPGRRARPAPRAELRLVAERGAELAQAGGERRARLRRDGPRGGQHAPSAVMPRGRRRTPTMMAVATGSPFDAAAAAARAHDVVAVPLAAALRHDAR